MSDRISLTWSEFQKFVASSFANARSSSDFSDVTLVGEDYQLEAHRLVLSAGSRFFHDLFKRAKHEHPLVYLKGTYKVEIEAILSFLYNAEVNIAQQNLTQFLVTSKELKVRGVMEDELDSEPVDNSSFAPHQENLHHTQSKDFSEDITETEEENFSDKEVAIKKASVRCHFQKLTETESKCNLCERTIQTKGGNTTGMWRHLECKHKDLDIWQSIMEKLSDNSIWNHFINERDGESTCKLCYKIIPNRGDPGSLWKHMAKAHQEVDIWQREEASNQLQETSLVDSKAWNTESSLGSKRMKSQPWEERQSSNPIWSCFVRIPGYVAKCKQCDRCVSFVYNFYFLCHITFPLFILILRRYK